MPTPTVLTRLKQLLVVVCIYHSMSLFAVPADPTVKIYQQPNGKSLSYVLRGDENFHYKSTTDGYALTEDNSGYMTYAEITATGQLLSSGIAASNADERTAEELAYLAAQSKTNATTSSIRALRAKQAESPRRVSVAQHSYPLSGSPKSLVLLVNFTDRSFITSSPQATFTKLCNQTGYNANGATGSARDYFISNSQGNFSPEFDVYGPYTLSHPESYYGRNAVNGTDSLPQLMVIEACTLAKKAGVDFTQYDTDNDGIVDNVFVFYAGYNEAEGAVATSLWAHRWGIYPQELYGSNANYSGTTASVTFDGKRILDYACTSELKSTAGNTLCGIGTFCHEFCHVLGLVDLYDTKDTDKYRLFRWDLMDSGPYLNGGKTPPNLSAYERYFLNWLSPTDLTISNTYSLSSLESTNGAYIISTINNRASMAANNSSYPEYFILENRQNSGWDTYLPYHGMLVTHINYNASAWAQNTANNDDDKLGVDLVEADKLETMLSTMGDPFPGTEKVSSFSPVLHSGASMNRNLTSISESNNIIQFSYTNSSGDQLNLMNDGAGKLIVITSNYTQPLYVYNATGQLLRTINLSSTRTEISDLPRGIFLILKTGKLKAKAIVF